jgi:CBS domain-containing protein
VQVSDVMTSEVVTVGPETSVEDAAELMVAGGFAALPVVDGRGRVVGIVAGADVRHDRLPDDPLRHVRRTGPGGATAPPTLVGAVMRRAVRSVEPTADLADVARLVVDNALRSVPVVHDQTMVGILSRGDVLRALVQSDESIRSDVAERVEHCTGEVGAPRPLALPVGGIVAVRVPPMLPHGRRASATATSPGALLTPARTDRMTGALHPTTTEPLRWAPPRPTPAGLVRQVRDVVADAPRFLTAPVLRSWHLRWGASPAEVTGPMPGDDLFPRAQYRCTRAITIAASPEEVWPWLVQVGCLRAGWYADDLLDNVAHPSARQIVPQLQDLQVGRWLPMAPTPSASSAFVVDSVEAPRWMLWRTPSSSWAWRLVPLPDGRTRLITRLHAVYDWRRASTALWMPLMELGDFPMMRRMLRGIRERAEAEHRRLVPPPVDAGRLALIRGVHTAAWFSIESCVAYLLWSGAVGRSDRRAAAAAAVVAGECLVFTADGFRCPMTGLAEAAGARSGSVTDIYLPTRLAENLPAIHLPLLALIGWLHWRTVRRRSGVGPLRWTPRARAPRPRTGS